MNISETKTLVITVEKRRFDREIAIRREDKIRDLSVRLGVKKEIVAQLWNGV